MNKLFRTSLFLLMLLFAVSFAFAQDATDEMGNLETQDAEMVVEKPTAPQNVKAYDKPNDAGTSIMLEWTPVEGVDGYVIRKVLKTDLNAMRLKKGKVDLTKLDQYLMKNDLKELISKAQQKAQSEGEDFDIYAFTEKNRHKADVNKIVKEHKNEFKSLKQELESIARRPEDQFGFGANDYLVIDKNGKGKILFEDNDTYENINFEYFISSFKGDVQSDEVSTGVFAGKSNWWKKDSVNLIILLLVFAYFAIIKFYVSKARRGLDLYIRPINGLNAVDEAVGRATEMGKPMLFVPGMTSIDDVATIAALNILERIAKKAAEYDTPLYVPCRDFLVLPVAQEMVNVHNND